MNKLILGSIAALILAFTGLVVTLEYQVANDEVSPALGAGSGFAGISQVASTSGTYFDVTGASTRTATATLLTIGGVYNYSKIGLEVNVWATTTIAKIGTVYVQPQTSYDASVWADWTPNNYGTGGTAVQTMNMAGASTTVLAWAPGELGTTTKQFVFDNAVGKYMRFKVWTTGTSTILLRGNLQN